MGHHQLHAFSPNPNTRRYQRVNYIQSRICFEIAAEISVYRCSPQQSPSRTRSDEDAASIYLQRLVMDVRLRRGYHSSLFPGNVGDRSDRPSPAKVAILVDGPSCATAFPDLHSPVIAVGRNCESKCNRSRHNHTTQISNEECAYQFVSLHFPYSISKLSVVPIVYLVAINLKR